MGMLKVSYGDDWEAGKPLGTDPAVKSFSIDYVFSPMTFFAEIPKVNNAYYFYIIDPPISEFEVEVRSLS